MKLFSILTAAACLLFVSACASTPAPTDERVHISDSTSDIQPGNIYISPEAAKIFTFRDADHGGPVESEINENGYLAVRLFGQTCDLSALKWAFFGDVNYDFAYRFYWFDAEGNQVDEPGVFRLRSTIPGDPVRFVGHAPTEECRNFAMSLFMASEQPTGDNVKSAEPSEEEADTRSEAAKAEEEKTREAMPTLPEENVSGDAQDVKTIGVPSSSTPAAVPADVQEK